MSHSQRKRGGVKRRIVEVSLAPVRWVAGLYPGLDGRSSFLAVSAAVILTLFWHHARAAQYYTYVGLMPGWARSGDPALSGLYAYVYSHVGSAVLLLLLPMGIIRFVLGDRVRDYGLGPGRPREWSIALALYLILLPVLVSLPDAVGDRDRSRALLCLRRRLPAEVAGLGVFLPRIPALWLSPQIRRARDPDLDPGLLSDALRQARARGIRFDRRRIRLVPTRAGRPFDPSGRDAPLSDGVHARLPHEQLVAVVGKGPTGPLRAPPRLARMARA